MLSTPAHTERAGDSQGERRMTRVGESLLAMVAVPFGIALTMLAMAAVTWPLWVALAAIVYIIRA